MIRGLRAGYDFCGYGEDCVCAPHGPCDCRDDDLGPFDDEPSEKTYGAAVRRKFALRGTRLVEITDAPVRETR